MKRTNKPSEIRASVRARISEFDCAVALNKSEIEKIGDEYVDGTIDAKQYHSRILHTYQQLIPRLRQILIDIYEGIDPNELNYTSDELVNQFNTARNAMNDFLLAFSKCDIATTPEMFVAFMQMVESKDNITEIIENKGKGWVNPDIKKH